MIYWFALLQRGGRAVLLWFLLLTAGLTLGWAEEFGLESTGARFGVGANSSAKDFHQAEAFLDLNLPWSWDLGRSWQLRTRVDCSLGWLGNQYRDGAIATAGPMLILGHQRIPVHLEAGVSPTGLSRSEYESKDFGVLFQFTSYGGLYWDFAPHFRVGYRFQHMSNASISASNPGLNLHMFGLSYRF